MIKNMKRKNIFDSNKHSKCNGKLLKNVFFYYWDTFFCNCLQFLTKTFFFPFFINILLYLLNEVYKVKEVNAKNTKIRYLV